LANRRLLDAATIALRKNENHPAGYAVLHLDLDHFKRDAVLCAVSQRLKDVIGEAGLVCRIGGDEFAVLFETAPSRKEIDGICNQIIRSVSNPIDYEGNRCKIGVSIGCAFGHVTAQESREIFLCVSRDAARIYLNLFRDCQSVADRLSHMGFAHVVRSFKIGDCSRHP